jgi:hypothetical protein
LCHQAPAVTHREGERPQLELVLLAFAFQGSQMSSVHLRLLAGLRFETSHGYGSCRVPLGVQPVLQNRVSAGVVCKRFKRCHGEGLSNKRRGPKSLSTSAGADTGGKIGE